MSMMIKGIQMPARCAECPCNTYGCVCQVTKKTYPFGGKERPKDCPLGEIPEKHGDLIDRDRLSPDREWSLQENGYTQYSTRQIMDAPIIIKGER